MKILVTSDSHSRRSVLERIIEKNPDCPLVFFLGDGCRDVEGCMSIFPDRKFICVAGNNDLSCKFELEAYKYIQGCSVVAVHGHRFNVRQSLSELKSKADSVLCNVAFYGHTHVPREDKIGRVTLINPGAVCDMSYAVCTIENGEIKTSFRKMYH